MRARYRAKSSAKTPCPVYYSGAGSHVEDEAEETHAMRRGSRTKTKSAGKVHGKKAHHRLDRRRRGPAKASRRYADGGQISGQRREQNPPNTSMGDIIRHGFDANPEQGGRAVVVVRPGSSGFLGALNELIGSKPAY